MLAVIGMSCRPPGPAFTQDDFNGLSFLLGQWQGASPGEPVFHESYERVNDSLIRILYHDDASMTTASDTGRVYLRTEGIYHAAGDAVWRLKSIDSNGYRFGPEANADNEFTWQPGPGTTWRAILHLTDGSRLIHEFQRPRP